MDNLFAATLIALWGDEWRHYAHKTWRPDLDDYDNGIGDKSRFRYTDQFHDNESDLDDFDW